MVRIVKEQGYAEKRGEILDAAQRLVFSKGYERLTIQDILQALDISKGALYHYFDSKQAVLEALIPGMGTYRLPRFIGLGRARKMVLTGEMVSADEALGMGLVDWVVPQDKIGETTNWLISTILKGSATALRLSKKLVNSSFETNYEEAFWTYLEFQQHSLSSEEHSRAMQEYRERKKQS